MQPFHKDPFHEQMVLPMTAWLLCPLLPCQTLGFWSITNLPLILRLHLFVPVYYSLFLIPFCLIFSWWLFWWQPYSSLALYFRFSKCCCFTDTNPGSSEPAQMWICWSMLWKQGWEEHWESPRPFCAHSPPDTQLCCIPAVLQSARSALAASSAQVRPKAPHLLSGFWVSVPAASADNGACGISQISFCTMTSTTDWFLT